MSSDPLPRGGHLLKITAYVDGASRGNPGPAGFGASLNVDQRELIEISGFLGVATNNVAEYQGLIAALEAAQREGANELEVISDSLLLVNQMLGLYQVKHPNMVPLHRQARQLARQFPLFSIRHTLRSGNKEADRLANIAVDRADGTIVERRLLDAG